MRTPLPRLARSWPKALVVGALVVTVVNPIGAAAAGATAAAAPYKAFSTASWWNTPLSATAPQHANEAGILDYLRTAPDNGGGFLRLAGAGGNAWGQPVYWAKTGDPQYNVRSSSGTRPPELNTLRIPAGMRPAGTSDGALTLFDVERGYVVAMTRAVYNSTANTWSVDGSTVTYLASNGLNARAPGSNDPRNIGSHRGNNGATMMVRYDEVAAGAIPHVLKMACGPETSTQHVFPMVNSDGDSTSSPIKQGLRFRIRADVNLDALRLTPSALVIARAAQQYGVYCGDSGNNTALKLENTQAEGRGQLWTVKADALAGLPFTAAFWDVVSEGYSGS